MCPVILCHQITHILSTKHINHLPFYLATGHVLTINTVRINTVRTFIMIQIYNITYEFLCQDRRRNLPIVNLNQCICPDATHQQDIYKHQDRRSILLVCLIMCPVISSRQDSHILTAGHTNHFFVCPDDHHCQDGYCIRISGHSICCVRRDVSSIKYNV